MDWLARLFDNPFSYGESMLTLMLGVFVLSVVFGAFRRRWDWMGSAFLAAIIGAFGYFLAYTFLHGFGPLSLMGLFMLFYCGVGIALPTVGVIRLLLRWLGGKPERAS